MVVLTMKLKSTFIAFSLLGAISPQISFSMDPPAPENQAVHQRSSIVIPSDVERTGLQAINSTPQMRHSWQALGSFTAQTMDNFQKGVKKGILYVHSLEDIMGAQKCFLENWNLNHPHDIRTLEDKDFHEVFTHQEYVDHYIPYILASRPLISGSILAFNDEPAFTLSNSFASVSFIMDVPAECIGVTSSADAQTPVSFVTQQEKKLLTPMQNYLDESKSSLITLDALVRYPYFGTCDGIAHYSQMNEVAILNCTKSEGKVYKPSILGVLFNPSFGGKSDYGNAFRNILWKDAAEEFCKKQNLPFFTLDRLKILSSEEIERTVVKEWYESSRRFFEPGREERLHEELGPKLDVFKNYYHNWIDFPVLHRTFLLTDEQLQGYGLKRQ